MTESERLKIKRGINATVIRLRTKLWRDNNDV